MLEDALLRPASLPGTSADHSRANSEQPPWARLSGFASDAHEHWHQRDLRLLTNCFGNSVREAGDRIVQNWYTASNAEEISDYSDWVVVRVGFEPMAPFGLSSFRLSAHLASYSRPDQISGLERECSS